MASSKESETFLPLSAQPLSRSLKILIYSFSLNSLAVGYLLIYLAAYLPEINFSAGEVGILLGLEGAVLIVSGIPFGILSDRTGRKNILQLGALALFPGILIFYFTTNFFLLAVAAAIFGLAEAAALSTWNALIADQTSLQNRDSAFALSFIVSNSSIALGALLPAFVPGIQMVTGLSSSQIHRGLLLITAIGALITALIISATLRNLTEPRREQERKRIAVVRGKNFGTLLRFSGINSLIGLGAGFIIPLITTWFYLKFHTPDQYTGAMLAAANLTIELAAILSPRVSKKYGPVNAIVMTQGLSTIFMLSVAFIPNALIAAGTYVVRTALMNMSSPLVDSYLMGLVAKEERGLASSINSLIWRIPNSASTIVGGFFLAAGFLALPFFLATTLYVIAISLFYANFRNIHPSA